MKWRTNQRKKNEKGKGANVKEWIALGYATHSITQLQLQLKSSQVKSSQVKSFCISVCLSVSVCVPACVCTYLSVCLFFCLSI